jgi:hypothetical protein
MSLLQHVSTLCGHHQVDYIISSHIAFLVHCFKRSGCVVFEVYILCAVVFLECLCKSVILKLNFCILHKARLFINYTVLTKIFKKCYGSSLFNSSC